MKKYFTKMFKKIKNLVIRNIDVTLQKQTLKI